MDNCVVLQTEVKSLPEIKLIDEALVSKLVSARLDKVVMLQVQQVKELILVYNIWGQVKW